MLLSYFQGENEAKDGRASLPPFLFNRTIEENLIAAAGQVLSVWRGHWDLSNLIQMLIGGAKPFLTSQPLTYCSW